LLHCALRAVLEAIPSKPSDETAPPSALSSVSRKAALQLQLIEAKRIDSATLNHDHQARHHAYTNKVTRTP
jgi:hypothetical protein